MKDWMNAYMHKNRYGFSDIYSPLGDLYNVIDKNLLL